MLTIEIIPEGGLTAGPPLRINATQVLIRNGQGTPVCVAGDYGPERGMMLAHADDDNFQECLAKLGIREVVIVDRIVLAAPPPGARLISGKEPRRKK